MLNYITVPVAAFMLTATAASAFNPDILSKINVDLSEQQITALAEAHDLREAGADKEEVKATLEAAGVDRDTMKEIRDASREVRKEQRETVKAAVEANDYDAFKTAIADTPLAEKITNQADFEKFVEAHELKEAGDKEGAQSLMAELGVEKEDRGQHGPHGGEENEERESRGQKGKAQN